MERHFVGRSVLHLLMFSCFSFSKCYLLRALEHLPFSKIAWHDATKRHLRKTSWWNLLKFVGWRQMDVRLGTKFHIGIIFFFSNWENSPGGRYSLLVPSPWRVTVKVFQSSVSLQNFAKSEKGFLKCDSILGAFSFEIGHWPTAFLFLVIAFLSVSCTLQRRQVHHQ